MAATTHEPRSAAEQEIWDFIKDRDRFTFAEVDAATPASEWQRTNYFARLKREGLLRECAREGKYRFWTVSNAQAAEAFAARQRSTKEGAMWRSIRHLRTFSADDIEAALSQTDLKVSDDDIRAYCQILLKAGYLSVRQKARPGVRPARYHLARDTGPQPPVQRQLAVVIDGNTDEPVWMQGGRV